MRSLRFLAGSIAVLALASIPVFGQQPNRAPASRAAEDIEVAMAAEIAALRRVIVGRRDVRQDALHDGSPSGQRLQGGETLARFGEGHKAVFGR